MKGYLNATRLVTKLKMLRSGKKSKCFIIVEGTTDLRLYSKFISSQNCEILIADSKQNVKACIEACNREGVPGVIGIVDADFNRLEESNTSIPNLFVTDEHDLECMLVHSLAYEKIIIEYANSNKYARFEGRMQKSVELILLENAARIGYLRWYSLKENLGLRFSDLDFSTFVDSNTLEIDLKQLIKQVLLFSKKLNLLKVEDICLGIEQLEQTATELWQVCCGHDLIELFNIGLSSIFGEYNAKALFPGQLEGSFRLAYSESDFGATKLYHNLIRWEQLNIQYHIFPYKAANYLMEMTV